MRGSLDVRVLGALEVRVDGSRRTLGGSRQQTALAVLVASANQLVSTDQLIDEVWPGSPPRTARKTLQRYLSHVRQLLDSPERLESGQGGYRLSIDLSELDEARFERHWAGARYARDRGSSLPHLEHALGEWRGPAFAGLLDAPLLLTEARRLDERRLMVTESLIDAMLALGRHEEVIPELRTLVDEQPFQEMFTRQLMLALYRAGRQADALDVYHRVARLLREELGLDPSADLQRLELQILRHDPVLRFDPPSEGRWVPSNPTSFVGRTRQLAEVKALLGTKHLVTIVGAPGVGKTRLALEVAAVARSAFPDGAWLVDLASQSRRDGVFVDAAAGVGLTGVPPNSPRDLARRLRGRRLLLLIDNSEHVARAVADLADAILGEAPTVAILATSRVPLRAVGEAIYELTPLEIPSSATESSPREVLEIDAVRLFVERARDARADFSTDEAAVAVIATVCQQLDGLPLAIELAAGQVRSRSVVEIAEHLADANALLALGTSRGEPRQRTMAAAMDWSYRLLSPAERRLLSQLSVFSGSFTTPAASAVAAAARLDARACAHGLSTLVDASLLTVAGRGRVTRFRLLEVVRAFAAERLLAGGQEERARRAHARHYARAAEAASHRLGVGGWDEAIDAIADDHLEYRQALDWLYQRLGSNAALPIAAPLGTLWASRGFEAEGARWLPQLLPEPPPTATGGSARRRALVAIAGAHIQATFGDYARAEAYGRMAERLARRTNDDAALADALVVQGRVATNRGEERRARQLVGDALALSNSPLLRRQHAEALVWMAQLDLAQGSWADARHRIRDGYRLMTLSGSHEGAAQAATVGVAIELNAGDVVAAEEWQRLASVAPIGLGEPARVVLAALTDSVLALLRGEPRAAWASALQVVNTSERLGMVTLLASGLQAAGATAIADGQLEAGTLLWGKGQQIHSDVGFVAERNAAVLVPTVERARRLLGTARFAELRAQARELSMPQAIAIARQLSPRSSDP